VLLEAGAVLAQSGIIPADIERVGQTGWQFLKINADARQAALGGCYAALGDGNANGIFGNPSAVAEVKRIDVQLNHAAWFADITYESVAAAWNLGRWGTVAASAVILDYGDMAETINIEKSGVGTVPTVTGRTFSASDIAVGAGYAARITDALLVGGSARWLRQGIAELSMSNISFDFGTTYYTGLRSLRLCLVARNFGPDSRFGGWSEQYQTEAVFVRMPIDFRLGLAMDFFDAPGSRHQLTTTADFSHPNDGPEKAQVGAEYSYDKMAFLRCGYKFNYSEQRFTLGAGLHYSVGSASGTLSYAYVDFGALTRVHIFSMGFSY